VVPPPQTGVQAAATASDYKDPTVQAEVTAAGPEDNKAAEERLAAHILPVNVDIGIRLRMQGEDSTALVRILQSWTNVVARGAPSAPDKAFTRVINDATAAEQIDESDKRQKGQSR
jgi:hypothetical protein